MYHQLPPLGHWAGMSPTKTQPAADHTMSVRHAAWMKAWERMHETACSVDESLGEEEEEEEG